jgi:NAD(P)-dependent dehydrogenase (short-subunit alcohol dehydrogenase family)
VSSLAGRSALVTGGGSGIGAASARTLAREGAKVAVVDIVGESAEAVAASIREAGGSALAVQADVADEDQVRDMVAAAVKAHGGLGILHNNAALTSPEVNMADGFVADMSYDLWNDIMRTNLGGYFLGAKHAIPHMLAAGGGVIINTASGAGLQGELMRPGYGTSKAAIIGLTRNIAAQYGKQGIRCVTVAPGLILTPGLKANLPDEAQQMLLSHHLTPALGEPEDVAELVAFLASDAARVITGTTIPVDGGFGSHTASFADETRLMAGAAPA